MSGLNDLARLWHGTDGESYGDSPRCDVSEAWLEASDTLDRIARTAWHPVSEPPTEHGIEHEMVLIWHPPTESMVWCAWDAVEGIYGKNPHYEGAVWARWRDVVLMPPQGGE